MYQWRDLQVAGGNAAAMPRGFGRAPVSFAPEKPPFRLAVDLAHCIDGKEWWRGVATLAGLVALLAVITPAPGPLPGGNALRIDQEHAEQLRALGVAPARLGGRSGGQMAASNLVDPLLAAPERANIDMSVRFGPGDRVGALLGRIGAMPADAARVASIIAAHAPHGIAPGTEIAIRLGHKTAAGQRPVERISLRAGMALELTITRDASGVMLTETRPIAVDQTPRRVRGRVGDGLYWSLRAAGVEPGTASDYLKALASQLDVGSDLAPDDRFDLIVANNRAATGENQAGPLLYAGINRTTGRSIQLLKWTVNGQTGWYEANSLQAIGSSSFVWPVNARITSEFGMRYHPILRYSRMHRGMDFGAHWGTPIVASADGQVIRAGWAGGYGQQVRLAHAGGISTSYSHMSRMVVESGSMVRQGQLLGYVGTTGLSTGPHLHYETYRDGLPVNPRSVRFAAAPVADAGALTAFRARLRSLLTKARG
ncbi:M23 family metallopeptidase [Sphingomonas rhizophila]|uniref:M23 family metallopeptidase n=1 Tax=Sphingomonas rhizophila TaxID=2071607 RepID=A0A7G9SAC8_9SPHN|nr:M23 family metallopeptidase [Sphingomonas rhizophila]QNN64803.1 M23 family metallopeptidase [Sphingomonas rhizophila]